MNLSGGSACIKYLLFSFNLIFVITGIVVLSIGAVIQGYYKNYSYFLDDRFFSAPALLIAVGAIVLIISFFGCCGAVKENHCMIFAFSIMLLLVFILELSGGIAGYVLRDRASDFLKGKLNESMHRYNKSEETREVWFVLQTTLECCGSNNYTDWEEVLTNTSLPLSCCPRSHDAVGMDECTTNTTNHYSDGCLKAFGKYVMDHAAVLGGAGIGIAFIQITGILIIGVGTTIKAMYNNFDTLLEDRFYSPATLLIAIGCIVFIVASFACCGTIRESTWMIMIFAVLLGVVFLLELSAAIAGYILQDGLKEYLVNRVNISMEQYNRDPEIASTIDFMQEKLQCCGLQSFHDWEGKLENGTYGTTTITTTTVPISCCLEKCKYIYGNGCINRLNYVISQSAIMLASATISIALLQLLGVMFACSLGRSIRHQKTERERKQWDLRERLLRKDSFYSDGKHSTSR